MSYGSFIEINYCPKLLRLRGLPDIAATTILIHHLSHNLLLKNLREKGNLQRGTKHSREFMYSFFSKKKHKVSLCIVILETRDEVMTYPSKQSFPSNGGRQWDTEVKYLLSQSMCVQWKISEKNQNKTDGIEQWIGMWLTDEATPTLESTGHAGHCLTHRKKQGEDDLRGGGQAGVVVRSGMPWVDCKLSGVAGPTRAPRTYLSIGLPWEYSTLQGCLYL